MSPCHHWNLRFITRCGTWLGSILRFTSIFLRSMLIRLVYSIWVVKWGKLTQAVDGHTRVAQSSGCVSRGRLEHHRYLWWNEVIQRRRLVVDDDSSLWILHLSPPVQGVWAPLWFHFLFTRMFLPLPYPHGRQGSPDDHLEPDHWWIRRMQCWHAPQEEPFFFYVSTNRPRRSRAVALVALVAPLGGAFVRKNMCFNPSHHLNSLIRKVASTATGGASPIGKVAPHSHGWCW